MYDPYDYMIKEWAPTQTHNISLNGKSGKTDYNMGLGYLDQSGIIKPSKHDDFKRYNGSMRMSTEINKYFRVYAGTLYSKRLKDMHMRPTQQQPTHGCICTVGRQLIR